MNAYIDNQSISRAAIVCSRCSTVDCTHINKINHHNENLDNHRFYLEEEEEKKRMKIFPRK